VLHRRVNAAALHPLIGLRVLRRRLRIARLRSDVLLPLRRLLLLRRRVIAALVWIVLLLHGVGEVESDKRSKKEFTNKLFKKISPKICL
jgi:hypothetical protein